jgi:hypothetical protein
MLPNGYRVQVAGCVSVAVDPTRDLHGPCVVRTASGDLLLCHQDSDQHHGGDGFTRQWRSQDNGSTWLNEGPVADWRSRGVDALFGEYGLAPNGRLAMLVQRREVLSGDLGILAAWLQVSEDDGRTWREIGPLDRAHESAAMYGRNVITRGDTMYVGVWSRSGHSLYVSLDQGLSWEKRSEIFSVADFPTIRDGGPPYYPHVVFCPDGSLLAMAYHTPPANGCSARRSHDNGRTWGPLQTHRGLRLWAPRMKRFAGEALIATGRDVEEHAAVAWFSLDNGETWGSRLIVDKPAFPGSYAYTDVIRAGGDAFWVFASSPRFEGKGGIIGVRLQVSERDDGIGGSQGRPSAVPA